MTYKARTIKRLIDKTKGRFFVCRFKKRTTGQRRKMLARTGVYKRVVADHLARRVLGLKPSKGLQFDPDEKNLALVFDVAKNDYRMIDLNTVEFFQCGNLYYEEKENDYE